MHVLFLTSNAKRCLSSKTAEKTFDTPLLTLLYVLNGCLKLVESAGHHLIFLSPTAVVWPFPPTPYHRLKFRPSAPVLWFCDIFVAVVELNLQADDMPLGTVLYHKLCHIVT